MCRRVAKRAYKTLSKLVGKMVPGYKAPYVSASISGPIEAEHAAAVHDLAGTSNDPSDDAEDALVSNEPEQAARETPSVHNKSEVVSDVAQALPGSESVDQVLDDILAAAVSSVEEAEKMAPTQQPEEQMSVAYGAATAAITDSLRNEVKKRKAEAEVRYLAALLSMCCLIA
jgi:hypothetical protein